MSPWQASATSSNTSGDMFLNPSRSQIYLRRLLTWETIGRRNLSFKQWLARDRTCHCHAHNLSDSTGAGIEKGTTRVLTAWPYLRVAVIIGYTNDRNSCTLDDADELLYTSAISS
mmetsp:Transcript_7087/g.31339  ORF Transcript_7087/g.31339 Transcript_7087/m.31339 type:complete len:115 (-) Transcript_7087:943-1287(-)